MGHYAENFRQKEFIQHLLDGINWAAGKEHKD
ncbi:ThuA domain-containing protein [Opitutia bacterium ISCC 51]|nr:ThuA domain-containing protein [Opitutae bacterium ISCC 51]QXD29859.1 ThuA domain-containing protein [Opitutae bacterium ISCC 52]